jgi:drug/metabolite transporter (DMT)-like permease
MKWGLMLLTVFASSCGDVLCASGMSEGVEIHQLSPSGILRVIRYIVSRRKVILGGLCYAGAFFSLLALLSVVPLSVAVPATALSFVIDTLAARFILHESVHWRRWIGVICVFAGIVLAVKPAPSTRPSGPGIASVKADKDKSRHNQPSAHGLDQKGAALEVLAKPRWP